MRGAINMELLLLKTQTVFGTEETALTATDLVETIGPAKLKVNPGMTEIKLVAGGLDQDASIPGITECDLSFSIYARASAADTPGQFGLCCESAAMIKAEAVDGTFTYNFTSDLALAKDATAWGYSGNLGTNLSILHKMGNGVINPKWSQETGKPAVMECTTGMSFVGIPASATQPTITKVRTLPPALIAGTLTFAGVSTYKILSFEFDPGQGMQMSKDPADTYGTGVSVLTERAIKWKAKVYRDVVATLGTGLDPYSLMLGKTITAMSIACGAAPQKVTFASTYTQITDVDHDDDNGIETWTLSGLCERNDFTVTLTTK